MKPPARQEPDQAPESWWLDLSREQFAKRVVQEIPRMHRSTTGKRRGRVAGPIGTEELER